MGKSKCYSCSFGSQCRSNKLEGRGKKTAKIMIVLEAPDWVDDNQGKILAGDGGKKLFYFLEKAGLKRSDVYVTNAVKCKPSVKTSEIKDKRDKVDKKTKEVTEAGDKPITMCRVHLLKEIKEIKPKVIVLMGKIPHLMMTGNNSVTEFRGHFTKMAMNYNVTVGEEVTQKTLKIAMLPSFSPVASLSKWEYNDYIIHDLKKAKEFVKTGIVPKTPTPKYTVIDSITKLRKWKKIMLKHKGKLCVHDYETTSLDFKKGEIINGGYSIKKDHTYIIYPIQNWPEEHQKKFTPEQKERVKVLTEFSTKHAKEIKQTIKEIHKSGIIFCGHNHKFDRKYALEAGIPFSNCRWDTIVMDAILDENKQHSLNIVMEYNGINYGPYDTYLWPFVNKDRKKKKPYTHVPPDMLDEYLAMDTSGCRRLFFKLHAKLKKNPKLLKLYKNQQKRLLDELTLMEFGGFRMHRKKMTRDASKVGKIIEQNVIKLRKLVNDPEFNPNSTQQLSAHMERMGFPFERLKIKQGKQGYSTDADSLMKFLRFKKWKKIPELVLLNRQLNKIKNTYIINNDGDKGMLPKVDQNGFLHCNFNVHTPRTGRLSSDTPNFQNIPNPSHGINIRNYFIPPKKGWVTWEADYSALEMKVVAHLSQDPVMLQELKDGTDMHSKNAVTFGHVLGFVDKSVDYDWFKVVAKYDPEVEAKYLEKYGEKKLKEIKELHPEFAKLRSFAKSVGFGLNYGIEARTLSEDHNVPLEDVEVAIDTYFKRYKKLAKWRDKQGNLAVLRGYLMLPTGRKRRFNQFHDWINSDYAQDIRKREFDIAEVKRQAMNFPVQGYANEIFTQGKLRVIERMRKEGLESQIRITIHDGVVGIGPKHEMARVKKICHEEMTTYLGKNSDKLTLNVDFNVNSYWYGPAVTDYEDLAEAA